MTQSAHPDSRALFRVDGKNALVVGGYGGLGGVTSHLLADAGAAVAVAGRSIDKARAMAEELSSAGARQAMGERVDVADRNSVDELVERVVGQLGSLDILVSLASIEINAPAEELGEDDWRRVIDVNLTGAFLLSQAAGRAMIAAGNGGRIIHFSSTRSAAGARRGFAAYGASKAGLNLLIKQLATEWGRHRINVNGVAPGFVPTELTRDAVADEKFTQMMLRRIPFGRYGEAVEMAGTALFLATPAAGFITGQIIFVDGGVTASS